MRMNNPNQEFMEKFNQSLAIGDAGEELFLAEIARRWPTMKIEDVSMDASYQRAEIDYILTSASGKRVTVEVKTDLNSWSKNMFIETIANKEIGRKGWIFTSQADILVYFYVNGLDDKTENMLWIDMNHIRQVVLSSNDFREKVAASEHQIARGGQKTTIGKLVPRTRVKTINKYFVAPLRLKNPHSAQDKWGKENG